MSAEMTSVGPGTLYLRPELRDLKIISVEEHVQFPDFMEGMPDTPELRNAKATLGSILSHPSLGYARERGPNLGALRLQDMDEGQIAMQILSFGSPVNSTFAAPEEGLKKAQTVNNALKAAADAHPTRFRAFAELPFQDPALAVQELRRCVDMGFVGVMLSGSVGGNGKFLDAPEFSELLSEFEKLDVPLFLHPGIPPEAVRKMYYDIPGNDLASGMMASGAFGWHAEVAVHVLRLAATGTLDAHPKLKIIIGHQGEMLPMMLQRLDNAFDHGSVGLRRSVGEALRSQVWISISGLFTLPATQIAIQTWGVDRVLFATDYPYVDTQRVPDFLKAMNDLVAPSDVRKIFQTNAEQLLKIRL